MYLITLCIFSFLPCLGFIRTSGFVVLTGWPSFIRVCLLSRHKGQQGFYDLNVSDLWNLRHNRPIVMIIPTL